MPALRKGRYRLYHSTFLILFCFFKERAQMSILILFYLHPVFKYTFIFASLLLFTFLRTLNSLRITIHEETWNDSFTMNYLCLLWGLLSVVRLSMPEIILLRQKNHFFPLGKSVCWIHLFFKKLKKKLEPLKEGFGVAHPVIHHH